MRNQKLKLFFLFLILVLFALNSGCSRVSGPEEEPTTPTPTPTPTTPSIPTLTLDSIAVTPDLAQVNALSTIQFAAMGTYSDQSIQNLAGRSALVWSASPGIYVSIDPVTGLATAGTTATPNQMPETITATFMPLTGPQVMGSTQLTVSAIGISNITIDPLMAQISINGSQLFTANASFSDGSSGAVTSPTITWAANNVPPGGPTVATIGPDGIAMGVNGGTANITATAGGVTSNPSILTVMGVAPTETVLFQDDFELGNVNGWSLLGLDATVVWEIGPIISAGVGFPTACIGGAQCWGTILGGAYPPAPGGLKLLYSPPITIGTIGVNEQVLLRFQHWADYAANDINNFPLNDQGEVFITGVDANGVVLTAEFVAVDPNRIVYSTPDANGIIGWTLFEIDITLAVQTILSNPATAKISLAFYHVARNIASTGKAGWYIDDVSVVRIPAP